MAASPSRQQLVLEREEIAPVVFDDACGRPGRGAGHDLPDVDAGELGGLDHARLHAQKGGMTEDPAGGRVEAAEPLIDGAAHPVGHDRRQLVDRAGGGELVQEQRVPAGEAVERGHRVVHRGCHAERRQERARLGGVEAPERDDPSLAGELTQQHRHRRAGRGLVLATGHHQQERQRRQGPGDEPGEQHRAGVGLVGIVDDDHGGPVVAGVPKRLDNGGEAREPLGVHVVDALVAGEHGGRVRPAQLLEDPVPWPQRWCATACPAPSPGDGHAGRPGARLATSSQKRVLPMPASPLTSNSTPEPAATALRPASANRNSPALPT